MATKDDSPRTILMVVTVGGFTHAAPVLELGKVLAQRGYNLDSKYLFDFYWTQTYRHLQEIIKDPKTRPDLILADFFVDAVKDMLYQYNIPIAIVYPQIPALICPCSYIPGEPGFQLDGTLTSEHASIWSRIQNELVIVRALPSILRWLSWTKKMRARSGVHYKIPTPSKPNYLVLIISFFGLEVPKDLPPLVVAIGPILADTYPPLTDPYKIFLDTHKRTLYLALGTHIILSNSAAVKLVNGLLAAIDAGYIDGVIWSIPISGRRDLNITEEFTVKGNKDNISFKSLLEGGHSSFLFTTFAPQRAILDHPHTSIYLTHGGGSSANEGLYHGKPMLVMGFLFDQISNVPRLVASRTSQSLDKFKFTADEVCHKIGLISQDEGELYKRNCLRTKQIATIASRRKQHGADLIEELLYDTLGRYDGRTELLPMHLQTADMRMSAFRAKNWDIWLVSIFALGAVPLASTILGRWAWKERKVIGEVIGAFTNNR